jgi:hypothetical protein
MLLTRRFLKQRKDASGGEETPVQPRVILAFFLLMLLLAFGLRLWQWMTPPETFPLLPQERGLVEVSTIAEADERSTIRVIAPPLFQNVYVAAVGVYTISSDAFPSGTIAIELARGDWRFVEIIEKPRANLLEEARSFSAYKQEDVVLNQQTGILVNRAVPGTTCKEPNDANPVGLCEITRILLFEKDGLVITLSADGTHATEGELITLAKSMITSAN